MDEDFDSVSLLPDPTVSPGEVILKTQMAVMRLLKDRGAERRFGRLLYGRLRALWPCRRWRGGAAVHVAERVSGRLPHASEFPSSLAKLCWMPAILPSKS